MKALVIFGMPRSGTSFLFDWIGERFPVLRINEPHLIWKKRRFRIEDNGPFDAGDVQAVRDKFKRVARGRPILEKSPANIVRAEFVLDVFPDASYVIVDRDERKILASCLKRTKRRDQMSGITIKKYLGRGTDTQSGASSPLPAWQQIDLADFPKAIRLFAQAERLRRQGILPFGPRISDFAQFYPKSPTHYYERLIEISHKQKSLLESRADCFRLDIETFHRHESELEKFCMRAFATMP